MNREFTVEHLIECFLEKNINDKEALKILTYFLGDDLERLTDAYISKRAKMLFRHKMPQDEARREVNKLVNILEAKE